MRGLALVLAAVGAASLGLAAGGSAAAMSIEAGVLNEPNRFSRMAWLRGVASEAPAGAAVEIFTRECGDTHFRERTSATVAPTKAWETTLHVRGRTDFRARWGDELSPIVTVTPPVLPYVDERRRGRFTVTLNARRLGDSFARKPVVLQRLTQNGWVRVRQQLLRRGSALRVFETTFTVRTRGLTLRVVAPAATVAPCFTGGASPIFRS